MIPSDHVLADQHQIVVNFDFFCRNNVCWLAYVYCIFAGFSLSFVNGILHLVAREYNRWTGLLLMLFGVLRHTNKHSWISTLLSIDFLYNIFTVFTANSVFPLLWYLELPFFTKFDNLIAHKILHIVAYQSPKKKCTSQQYKKKTRDSHEYNSI
jgi:hypothetical protein